MTEDSSRPKAFIIMPFDKEFDDVYKKFITVALNEAGYEVFRANDLQTHRNILLDILSSIISCDLIVADLTAVNANVYYELGLAHGLKKPVVLLSQSLEEIPFDLKPYSVIAYNVHFTKIEEAKTKLTALARGALEGKILFGSPVTDFEESKAGRQSKVRQITEIEHDSNAKVKAMDERGFLDHVVDLEDGFENLTGILDDIRVATETIGKETEGATFKIQSATTKPTAGRASYLRKISREFGEKISKYAQTLSEANHKYEQIARNTDNSLEFIISYHEPTTESDREELRKSLEALAGFEDTATEGKESIKGYADVIKIQPKMERHLDRALSHAYTETTRLVENIERTVASIRRARVIGLKKLQDYKKNSRLE